MSDMDYVYAVARIRCKELKLFSAAVIEQLLARPDYDACVSFLAEKGWGGPDTPRDGDAILTREREKTWEEIRELVPDMSVFELLDYTNVFHNLKAAVKEVCTGAAVDHIYYKNTKPSPEEIRRAVREKDFDAMAFKTMLRQLISKWGIMSIDLQAAVDKDMAVIHEDGSAEFVENEPEAEDTVVSDQELNEVPAEQPEEKAGSDVEDEIFNN